MFRDPACPAGLVLGCFLVASSAAAQPPLRVEGIYPRQLPIGERTIVNLVVPTLDELQAEIGPAAGIAVTSVTRGDSFQGAHTWWAITVDVGKDAAPGDRILTLRFPGGRAISTTVAIPSHVPRIAELRVLGPSSGGAATDVDVTVADDSADLGGSPYVWFSVACGGLPLPGVVRGSVAVTREQRTSVRATIPRPSAERGNTAVARCDLRLRVTDAAGFDSNTLSTALDESAFGATAAAPAVADGRGETRGGDWEEVISREERFTALFPGRPDVRETMWPSQYGAVLPARTYSASRGRSRYSLTVVDYNPVERLLVERSRACPPGANTCEGIADWGVGYWKTDIRGALLYVVAKYLERDAKPTSIMWNGIALVQGIELRLANPDQSRTYASIYMHENRLLVIESTVPRGDPPPGAFNESVNWLDAKGDPVRYQGTYVNIPDVPRPLPRGAPAPAQ